MGTEFNISMQACSSFACPGKIQEAPQVHTVPFNMNVFGC